MKCISWLILCLAWNIVFFFSVSVITSFSKNQLSAHKVRRASRMQITVEQFATLKWRLLVIVTKPTRSVPRNMMTHSPLLFHRMRQTTSLHPHSPISMPYCKFNFANITILVFLIYRFLHISLYDKGYNFNFPNTTVPFLIRNILSSTALPPIFVHVTKWTSLLN